MFLKLVKNFLQFCAIFLFLRLVGYLGGARYLMGSTFWLSTWYFESYQNLWTNFNQKARSDLYELQLNILTFSADKLPKFGWKQNLE